MAQLMFNIASEPLSNILPCSPRLLPCLVDTVNKAITKQPEERCQTGDEITQPIKELSPPSMRALD